MPSSRSGPFGSVWLVLAAIGAPSAAAADAPSSAALLVWPAAPSAEATARALGDRAAERGAFEVVDASLVRRRVAAGPAVSVETFLGEVRRTVAAASATLATGDAQGALDRIDAALSDWLADLATAAGRATLRDVLMVRARGRLSRNDPVGASADAGLAVRLDPEGALDTTSLLPGERALLARAREEAPTAAPGRLRVESVPAGAEVLVDGTARGATPLELELPYGRHVVRMERLGFAPRAALVDVAAGETASERGTLAPVEGPDLVEQIAQAIALRRFDPTSAEDLGVLGRATGASLVLVVQAGPHPVLLLAREGRVIGTERADAGGPYDAVLARLERAALGRAGSVAGVPAQERSAPITSRWWFWTAIGVVVVGGVTLGVVAASQPDEGGAVRWSRP